MNAVIDSIFARTSSHKMLDCDISNQDLDVIIKAGMTANDHGRLKPWRFEIYQNSGRKILANALVEHELAHGDPASIKRAETLPYRSPVVICVIATPVVGKIPLRDQLFSAAAACQLITLSAFSLGIGSIWRTGTYAESRVVKAALNIKPNEEIVGFIYLGQTASSETQAKTFPHEKVIIHV